MAVQYAAEQHKSLLESVKDHPERAQFALTLLDSVLDILADSDMKLSEYRKIESERDQISFLYPDARSEYVSR